MHFLAAALIFGLAAPLPAQMITESQIAQKREKNKAKLSKLSAADFQRKTMLEDDDLTTIATIDTKRGFQTTGGLLDIQGADVYLRAHIDKRDGSVSIQLYAALWYKETDQRHYTIVNYQDAGSVRSAALTTLRSDVVSCDEHSAVLGCTRAEDIVFDVPEDVLRRVAALPADQVWRFKLRAQAGIDWEDMISPAEAAGLLEAVDAYKIAHGLRR